MTAHQPPGAVGLGEDERRPTIGQQGQIPTRRGLRKANVAIQRALLVAIWYTTMIDTPYNDPGGDLNPQRVRNNAVRGHRAATTSSPTRHPDRNAHQRIHASRESSCLVTTA
jgi:hypothetical protein